MAKGSRLELAAAAALIRPRDTLLCGFVAGQPAGLLDAIGTRRDLEDVVLYTGLLLQPYALLQNPGIARRQRLLRSDRAHGARGRSARHVSARRFQRARTPRPHASRRVWSSPSPAHPMPTAI
jgi:hypothetical protein